MTIPAFPTILPSQPSQPVGNPKPIIGLIGGIGGGKSHVAELFLQYGGRLVSGDQLGHQALTQPVLKERILNRWKERVLGDGGEIDRRKLGAIVFASPVERTNLELIVFPWIEQRVTEEVAFANHDSAVKFVLFDAAIMLEHGWDEVCDYLVYIHAPRRIREARLLANRGWSPDTLAAREAAQYSLTTKATRADAAVDNSGGAERLPPQVESLLKQWDLLQ